MSNVVLQFGQCGNQIGRTLYEFLLEDIERETKKTKINSDYSTEAFHKWFTIRKDLLEPKSILIDTEEKVTNTSNKNSRLKYRNIVSSCYGGSANNWAYGYTAGSSFVLEETLERLRKEIEACDYIGSIINLLSSSGGTGSGVGSKVIESVHEEYPSKYLVNVVVLPYRNGDVATQNYNTLLTLARLYPISDSVILFENDKVHNFCKSLSRNYDADLNDLNYFIAQQLASVMQPIEKLSLSAIMSQIVAHPSYKFLQIATAPHFCKDNVQYETKQSCTTLLYNVTKNCKNDINVKNTLCKKIRFLGNILITRGVNKLTDKDIKRYLEPSSYVNWVPENSRLFSYTQERKFGYYDQFISLLTNNNNICNSINFILDDAWKLFIHSAYTHHYKKYGLTDECFLESFQNVENILNDYKIL